MIIAVRVAGDPAGKRGFGVLVSIGIEGLLGGFNHSELVGLSPLVFLLEVADELLCIDVLLGICVDKVKLTSDELVSILVPGFQQGGSDDAFE